MNDFRIDGTGALAAQPARAPRSLWVAPPLPVAVPRTPFVALVLALVVGGVLGILLLNTKINENAFRLDKLRTEQAQLDLREQQLRRELAEREAAGNLEAEVRRLGGVPAGNPAYLRLADGKVFGEPQPAAGQPSVTSENGGR